MLFKKAYFGIDIYDNAIKIMELSGNPNSASVKAFSHLELQSETVKNGEIINKSLLTQSIKQVLSKAQPRKISTKNCLLAIPESKLILTHLLISKEINQKDLAKTIFEKVNNNIPFQLDNIYYDYRIVLEYQNKFEVLFAAVQKEFLNNYLEIFNQCGLKLRIVDFESACLVRSLINHCDIRDICAIIDIGARTTIATVYDYCSIRFTDNIPIAGNDFTKAISTKWDLFFQEAEEFKKAYGLDPYLEQGKVRLILEKPLQQLLSKIKQDLYYYQEKNNKKISKIILCGGSSQMPKLPEYFAKNFGIQTEIGNPFIKIKNKIQVQDPVRYATVCGLALRALEKKPEKTGINLLNNI